MAILGHPHESFRGLWLMSSVEIAHMSADETGQMSAVETRQMSSAETRQMSTGRTGRCPVSLSYLCLVSPEDICTVQGAAFKAWLAEAATAADESNDCEPLAVGGRLKSFRGAPDDPSLTPKQNRHRHLEPQ